MPDIQPTELVALDQLRPHPRNYRHHPADQLDHIIASIKEHGIYRNVIVAQDGTILAGHGVVEAATVMGLAEIPVVRLPLGPDDPRALKLLAGDNEIGKLAEVDDRALSEILKAVKDTHPQGLAGTGFDEMMLANLVYVTRTRDEIQDQDAAAHWVGLPGYDAGDKPIKLVVQFRNQADRTRFGELLGISLPTENLQTGSVWYPERKNEDLDSLAYDVVDDEVLVDA